MRRLSLISALLLWLPWLVTAVRCEPQPPPQPYELVRTLQSMQNQIALGVKNAHAAQRAMLAAILKAIAEAQPDIWADPRNTRAVFSFVLSGGDPRPLRELIAINLSPAFTTELSRGVLAFGEGRNKEAQQFLDYVDARMLDPSIAGHVALIQGILYAGGDAPKAMSKFDDAELLSPGTLVEEAALRRNSILTLQNGNFRRGLTLSSRYLRRFPYSGYGESFLQQFALQTALQGSDSDASHFADISMAVETLPPARRAQFYIAIAQAAILRGKVKLALKASARANGDGAPSSIAKRARLYEALALVAGAGKDWERGRDLLNGMSAESFNATDADLQQAALSLADAIRKPSEKSAVLALEPSEAAIPKTRAVERAEGALARAVMLIGEVK
ncbi:MAG: hypothetical protein SGJ17_05685 [Hyphomicrobiales bacterium]|nr:hypothetical protein [Hyphomicrobiales bacterium]